MSDLLSPIYYVFDANEADAFWGLVGVMKMMVGLSIQICLTHRNRTSFATKAACVGSSARSSSLYSSWTPSSTLISVGFPLPDVSNPAEKTESLNLFFVFRWILISFKREFKFENVIKLWEVLWTNYYSTNFVLFITLAVLHSHRDVILRYLTEFDEVLKYANDLSGTVSAVGELRLLV